MAGISPRDLPRADVGVFGGSGFYRFLDDARMVSVATPAALGPAVPRV